MPSTLTDGQRQVFIRVLERLFEDAYLDFPLLLANQVAMEWFESTDVDRVQRELDHISKWNDLNLTIGGLKLLETAIDYLADET